MPVWHALTKPYQDKGLLNVVGVIQEQHPDRALLFMQWHQMEWPLLVDSLNLLGVTGAPVTVFLDEAGVIRSVNPSQDSLSYFLRQDFAVDDGEKMSDEDLADVEALLLASAPGSMERGDFEFLWGVNSGVDRAISAYRQALSNGEENAATLFRLGVAHRRRYDSDRRQADDFTRAVVHWSRALELNPNQYIWRRRIQQYGPRLTKPYSFYDWIHEARKAVEDRGELPVRLEVEPGGAEFASPSQSFVAAHSEANPDPDEKIHPDSDRLIQIECTAVPGCVRPGEAIRVHVLLRPDKTRNAHWNNETEGLILWAEATEGWQIDKAFHRYPLPSAPVSVEPRKIEFEVKTSAKTASTLHIIRGYVLYSICEGGKGQCLYRRQNFEVKVSFKLQ